MCRDSWRRRSPGTPPTSSQPFFREENAAALRLSLLSMLCFSFLIGFWSERDHNIWAGAAALLLCFNYSLLCRLAGMKVGSQGLLLRQTLAHGFLIAVVATVFGVPWAFAVQLEDYFECSYIWFFTGVPLVIILTCSLLFVGAGTTPIFGFLLCLLKGLAPIIWPRGATPPSTFWMALLTGAASLPLGLVKYRYEQCSLALVPLVLSGSLRAGSLIGKTPSALVLPFLCLLPAYLQVLWMRRRRVLPVSLRGCKFVTLTYLRQVAASGEGIRRCQDLPPEAFGDPGKARFLIIASHRWMDRFACDHKTPECPEGLRLHFLLEKLNCLFSTEGLGQGNGFFDKIRRLQFAMTGGSDVLLFFDFMSLPQEGRTEDGVLLPRTHEEAEIFKQCLPSMGVLYSMFPVMVCPEVSPGHTSYLDSGWCFSESSTAWLGQQLGRFPTNAGTSHWFDEKMQKFEDVGVLGNSLDTLLATKTFLFDTDRALARRMIGGFVLKRQLIFSLRNKSPLKLQRVLDEIAQGGFASLVDQPVDAALNTPLHYAVAANFSFGVRQLMDAGADKTLCNIYGDTPVQLYMFPRWNPAARLCRALASETRRRSSVYEEDMFNTLAQCYTLSADSMAPTACVHQLAMGETSTVSPRNTCSQESFGNAVVVSIDDVVDTIVTSAKDTKIGKPEAGYNNHHHHQQLVVNLDDLMENSDRMSSSSSLAN